MLEENGDFQAPNRVRMSQADLAGAVGTILLDAIRDIHELKATDRLEKDQAKNHYQILANAIEKLKATDKDAVQQFVKSQVKSDAEAGKAAAFAPEKFGGAQLMFKAAGYAIDKPIVPQKAERKQGLGLVLAANQQHTFILNLNNDQ